MAEEHNGEVKNLEMAQINQLSAGKRWHFLFGKKNRK